MLLTADHHPAAGTARFVHQSVIGPQNTGGHQRRARLHNGPVADDKLGAIRQKDAYPISLLHAQSLQGCCQLFGKQFQLPVFYFALQIKNCCLAGVLFSGILILGEAISPNLIMALILVSIGMVLVNYQPKPSP
jgi:hypothetical protein